MSDHKEWLTESIAGGWSVDPPHPIDWAEEFVRLPGSARSQHFRCDITPWIREPILRAAQGLWVPPDEFYLDMSTEARIVTLEKPVQSGGSVFGEVMMLYWLMFGRGIFQYNWSNDKRAKERWDSRIDSILDACAPFKAIRDALPINKNNKCEIDLGRVFFRVQGAFVSDNLDSDSVPMQLNEEVHSWTSGHLNKARNRSTAVWNFKSLDVSNAGDAGDQLDKAFRNGSAQYWEVLCPGCSNPHHAANSVYHKMRTRFDKKHPELGGLCYDADGARRKDRTYDYNKIRSTVHFKMPCGYQVHDDPSERVALSTSGRYSEPTNTGCDLTHRSYTYEAVSVDFIDWMKLIKEKHDALRARDYGDPKPWIIYMRERECIPYDPNDVPIQGGVVTVSSGKKNRDGLPGEKLRLGQLDRQQGNKKKGELPHWWGTIRDFAIVDGKIRSLLVFEGKLETDELASAVMTDHEVRPWCVLADSGDDTTHVYLFCMQHGFNCIKGGNTKESFYPHADGARRIFSPERPLHSMIGCPPKYEYVASGDKKVPDPREPVFVLYSKGGIRERLHWLRTNTEFITPEDVSEDYHAHNESEIRMEDRHPTSGERVFWWHQRTDRNDLFVCECYSALQLDMAGWIAAEVVLAGTSGELNDKNKPDSQAFRKTEPPTPAV